MAEDGLDKKRQQFEDTQLSELDVQSDLDSDAVLAQAKTIGLISAKVLQNIEDSGVKDKLASSFKATKEKAENDLVDMETDPQKRKAKAFRVAFRSVYGRFMMETETLAHPANQVLLEKLKGVLKFEIDEHGVKSRPELQAAIGRLRLNMAPRWKASKARKVAEAGAERAALSKKKDAAVNYLGTLNLDKFADSVEGPLSEYMRAHPELQEFHSLETDISKLEANLEMIDLFSLIPPFNETVDEVPLTKKALSISGDRFNSLQNNIQTDQAIARKVLGIGTDKILDKNDIEIATKRMRIVFHPDKFLKTDGYSEQQSKAAETMFLLIGMASEALNQAVEDGEVQPVVDQFPKRDAVIRGIKEKKDKKKILGKALMGMDNFEEVKFTKFSDLLENFKNKINALNNDPDVSASVKDLCSKYLEAYKAWTENKDKKNPAVMSDFYNKTFKVFAISLGNALSSDIKSFTDGLAAVDSKIDQFQRDIIPADIVDSILAKAFPKTKNGAEIKRLERLNHEAEHDEHHLQDVYKYFSSPENLKKVSTSYHDLRALIAGAGLNDENTLNRSISKRNQEVKGKTAKRDSLAKAKTQGAKAEEENSELIGRISGEISKAEEELEQLNEIRTVAKAWKADLSKLVETLEGAHHAGIHVDFKGTKLKDIAAKLKAINPGSGSFNPSSLVDIYEMFGGFFENHHHEVDHLLESFDKASADKAKATKDSKKALDKANAEVEKSKNLTDAEAAKRIIGALVYEQFPDLDPMEHNKLVTTILADDVATLQTDEGYAELAQRATAEGRDIKSIESAFRAKLLNFRFKEGEKVIHPFKGLKPDDFKNWENIEKLFLMGKLNYKNAFFVLAAFKHFDNGIKSIQAVKLEKKLKELLAKQLGVDKHMDKAGLSKVVDDAFKDQMEKVEPLMKAHFDIVTDKGDKVKEHKKKVLDMKYADLNDQLRTKKIGHKVYEHKLEALIKEAGEADVQFSANTTVSKFWNSPHAQWLKDKAHNAGVFAAKKTLMTTVVAPLKIYGHGILGAGKLGGSLLYQGALLPFRAAKYPLLLAAKPVVGAINLFRANKWTPLPGLRDSVKNDAARVVGYTKEKTTGVVSGAKETISKTFAGEWNGVKYADTKYADRNAEKAKEREELLKIHEPKSELDAIEVAESPFVDLGKYKKQVDMVTKALGITIDAPSGNEPKVGHEEKPAEHGAHGAETKKEEPAHGAHGAEAKKEEPAHGAHGAHEEPKKAAGGGHP